MDDLRGHFQSLSFYYPMILCPLLLQDLRADTAVFHGQPHGKLLCKPEPRAQSTGIPVCQAHIQAEEQSQQGYGSVTYQPENSSVLHGSSGRHLFWGFWVRFFSEFLITNFVCEPFSNHFSVCLLLPRLFIMRLCICSGKSKRPTFPFSPQNGPSRPSEKF